MRLRPSRRLAALGAVASVASSLALAGPAATVAAASAAAAVNVDFAGFGDVSSLSLTGTTTVTAGQALRLTDNATGNQAGGAWLTTPIDTARDFSSHFRFETTAGTGPAGDGFTFTIQNAGTTALGSCGAGLGYAASPCDASPAISPSEAYGFDAAGGDEVLDGTNGALSDAGVTYADPHDGTAEQAWVDYDAATHALRLYTAAAAAPKPATPAAQRTIADLSAWTGSAYVGFTGGTGSDVLAQAVTSWSVHQPLDSPGSVTAVPGTAGAAAGHAPVGLTWTPPADDPNSAQVTSYTVYRSTDQATRGTAVGSVDVAGLVDPAQPSFTDDTATGGTSYYYTVTDTANGMESPGATSSQVTAPKTLPSAPLGLVAESEVTGQSVPTGGGAVTFRWTAPADLGGDASAGFDVLRSVNGGAFAAIASDLHPIADSEGNYRYTDDNLDAANYSYKVEAVNSQGDGPASNTITVDISTVVSAPVASASAPQNAALAVDGAGRTVLSWSAPAETSGSTVDHYAVYRAIGDETAPGTSFSIYRDGVADLSLPTQTMPAGTGFVSYYVVAVLANHVDSPPSNTATVFVPEAPVVQSVTSPSNGHAVVTGTVPNLPASVSVSYTALASDAAGACADCVSTPDGGGADVAGLGTGDWQFRLVPTTSYGGSTALGPASALSTAALTLHTIRYVSTAIGDDAGDCTVQVTPCATIARGLGRATAGDEVLVSPGTYAEGADISASSGPITGSFGFHYSGLAVTKSVQLVADSTSVDPVVIDATGHNNGLVVDRGDNFDNGGAVSSSAIDPDVVVSGFTIQNADAEGLFAFNSDAIRIAGNTIRNNDKGSFTTSITDDLGECVTSGAARGECGDGLHLAGLTRSIVTGNTVQANSGGILLDDALPNYPQVSVPAEGNTITQNTIVDNTAGAGLTIAGRDQTNLLGGFSLGVFDNVVSANVSSRNGSAGVLLVVGALGDAVYQNHISGNTLQNDALPGVAIHAFEPLAYMDDNVVEGNQISATGTDPAAHATATTGIAVHGLAADPIGGTLVRNNAISGVHYGVFLNEAAPNLAGNTFTGVTVPVTSLPGPGNVYAGRGTNGHLVVSSGTAGHATDFGGALATTPAVGAVPSWNPNALGAGKGYWSGAMTPVYVARTTAGRIAVRTNRVSWTNLPAPFSSGRMIAFAGPPAIAGSSALDNGFSGGRSLVAIATISAARGDLWLTSIVIGPNGNVVGISRGWRNFGHPSGTALTGAPALAGLFFTNTAWAAAKNGYLYSLTFDPFTADWRGVGNPWVRRAYKAITVAAATSPDGYRTALLLANLNGSHPGLRLTQVVYAGGVAGRLTTVNAISFGQPGVAVATNGITEAYSDSAAALHTIGAITKSLRTVLAGGVSSVGLN